MSISKIFIPNSLCVFSQIKGRKRIEQNFGGVKNFSVGICDGPLLTVRSSLFSYDKLQSITLTGNFPDACPGTLHPIHFIKGLISRKQFRSPLLNHISGFKLGPYSLIREK